MREGYFRDVVIQDVRTRLEEYLSALPPGGPDADRLAAEPPADEEGPGGRRHRAWPASSTCSRCRWASAPAADIEARDLTGLQLPRLAKLGVREGEAESLAALLGETTPGGPPVEVLPVPVSRTKC